jgi:uncharacterized protein YcbK (DUF882 family)
MVLMIAYSLRIGTALAFLATGATAASARHHSHSTHRHAALHGTHHQSHHRGHHDWSGDIARHDRHGDDALNVSRSCLTSETQNLLSRVEAAFGRVQIVSTCRPGAVVAGTGHPSQHRYGRAVDFNAPPGKKAAIVQWLIANNAGGTMTYSDMGHIHMDTGPRRFVSLGASSRGGGGHRVRVAALARRDGALQGAMASSGGSDGSNYPGSTAMNDGGGSVSSFGSTRSGEPAQRRRYAHHHRARHLHG